MNGQFQSSANIRVVLVIIGNHNQKEGWYHICQFLYKRISVSCSACPLWNFTSTESSCKEDVCLQKALRSFAHTTAKAGVFNTQPLGTDDNSRPCADGDKAKRQAFRSSKPDLSVAQVLRTPLCLHCPKPYLTDTHLGTSNPEVLQGVELPGFQGVASLLSPVLFQAQLQPLSLVLRLWKELFETKFLNNALWADVIPNLPANTALSLCRLQAHTFPGFVYIINTKLTMH